MKYKSTNAVYIWNGVMKRRGNINTLIFFNVSTWKEEFDIVIDFKRKIALLEELYNHIDKIHSELKCDNVYIHCLSGAHRSPFITGCYLAKYVGMKNKSFNLSTMFGSIFNILSPNEFIILQICPFYLWYPFFFGNIFNSNITI
ncbi:hypothetical protein RFI_38221 [Reticulomyxa filosa]|uniref:Tyrosine specific protein phosphatases domain-containing protein n=1 Tax=Reticulomyxa filosa TaxID=46433 RepID=X6LD00_RETFI|nr:hypothetical protein RFI_38221 [Reticulomyxa filosa]|eukprot:ETN99260.1 hypothetical protein RFI_38221 [Reticulomyxa filosa]